MIHNINTQMTTNFQRENYKKYSLTQIYAPTQPKIKFNKTNNTKAIQDMAESIKASEETKKASMEEKDKKIIGIKLSNIAEKIEKAEKKIEEETNKMNYSKNNQKNKSIFAVISENLFQLSAEQRKKKTESILSELQKQYSNLAMQLS